MDRGPIEIIEVGEETLYNAEKDCGDLKQRKIPKNMETDLPFSLQTRQKDRERPARKYNPELDDFVVNEIDTRRISDDLVGLKKNRSKPEVELEDIKQQSTEQE